MPTPTPTPSNLCRQPFLDRCYTPNSAEEQAARQNYRHIDTRYSAESTSETKSQQSTLALPGLREPAQRTKPARPVRTSIKKDLTVAEISCVARSLLRGDAINFFVNNCQLIYEGWISSLIGTAPLASNSTNESVIAAFDTLHGLRKRKDTTRLLMRFAYVQLIHAINAFKAAAKRDRFRGYSRRKAGHGDATIAINTSSTLEITMDCQGPNF
jgi:hypothetical protein